MSVYAAININYITYKSIFKFIINTYKFYNQGPVVQSVVSLTSSLRVISLTVLADSVHNILIFFCCSAKATHIFSSKKFQHICVSLHVNFNESLTNDIVSFEQQGPEGQVTGQFYMTIAFKGLIKTAAGDILKYMYIFFIFQRKLSLTSGVIWKQSQSR